MGDVTHVGEQLFYVAVMDAYETVTILVVAGAILVGVIDYFRAGGPLTQLGRQGTLWFDHLADWPITDRPSEDDIDAPIPRRPLRGRMR